MLINRLFCKGDSNLCIGHSPHLWYPPLQPIHHPQQSYCLGYKYNELSHIQWLCCAGWNGCSGDFHRCRQYPMDLLRLPLRYWALIPQIDAESTETVPLPYWKNKDNPCYLNCPMNFHSVRKAYERFSCGAEMLAVVEIWCKLLAYQTTFTVFKRLTWQDVVIPELKVMTSHISTYQSPMDMTKILQQGNDFQAQPYNKGEPLFMSRTPLKLLSNIPHRPWLLRALNWTHISHRILPGERDFDKERFIKLINLFLTFSLKDERNALYSQPCFSFACSFPAQDQLADKKSEIQLL